MAARSEPLLQHIRRLASKTNPTPDADLLTRFLQTHDEAAFSALVNRHGPMVLGVCRRILGDDSDAEDTFQATFLTLARKIASIRPADSLPAWLYGVARHLALKARRSRDRRLRREAAGAQASDARPQQGLLDQLTGREVLDIVDEELQRLPEVYRLPLILCYLEGHGHDEAARRLGWSLGSFRGRLERGRARLQTRLVRRGLALGAILLLWSLLRREAAAAVPPALMQATVQSAVHLAAGGGAGGVVSQIAVLAERVSKTLFATKAKTIVLLLGVVAAAAVGGAVARQDRPAPADEPKPTAETPLGSETVEKSARRMDRFGDPLPPGALARLGTMRLRQATGVHSLAFTPDGKGLITAGQGEPARLWDVASGRLLRQFGDNRDDRVWAVALSPDGRILAGGMLATEKEKKEKKSHQVTRDLCLWDVAKGTLLHRLKCSGGAGSLAFSPDGKTVASADGFGWGKSLRLWDVATGKELWTVETRENVSPNTLTYSADGKTLIWAEHFRRAVHLCDVATGKELRCWDDKEHPIDVVLVRAPDGRLFTQHRSMGKGERFVRLWDAATGKEVWRRAVEKGKGILVAAFSPDGKILATSSGATSNYDREPIRLWDTATGKELRCCAGCRTPLCLAFSPDGKTLASGSVSQFSGFGDQAVHFWDVASGREIRCADDGHQATISSVAFTPDGKDIVSSSREGSLRVWDAATGQQRRHLLPVGDEHFVRGWVGSIASAVSSDGKTFVSATWEDLTHIDMKRLELPSSVKVRRWDRDNGRELPGWSRELGSSPLLVFSPDGKTAACMIWSITGRLVYLWETATGKSIHQVAGGYPAFSPDGKLLATTFGGPHPISGIKDEPGSFRLWESATGKELCSVPIPEEGRVYRLLFSPDGRMLATASTVRNSNRVRNPQGMIHLWPLVRDESGKSSVRIGPPRVLAAGIPFLLEGGTTAYWLGGWAFSPDGRTLALASGEGGTVRLLETASGKERARFVGHSGDVTALAFAPDGRRLVSGSCDTTLLVWDVTGRLQGGRRPPAQLSAKEIEKLWADLAADDARRTQRAIWALAASADEVVPYLRERLRTSAADAKALLAKVPQLLRDLDDDAFAVREQAKAELARLGVAAEPALRQALAKSPSLETRRSLEQLLKAVEAKRRTLSGELLRTVRALEVLEQIGTCEARAALQDLTAGAGAESSLTREAQAALQRLDRAERR